MIVLHRDDYVFQVQSANLLIKCALNQECTLCVLINVYVLLSLTEGWKLFKHGLCEALWLSITRFGSKSISLMKAQNSKHTCYRVVCGSFWAMHRSAKFQTPPNAVDVL